MRAQTENASFRKLRILVGGSAAAVCIVLVMLFVAQTWASLKRTEDDVGRNLQSLALSFSEQADSTFRTSGAILNLVRREIYERGGPGSLSDRQVHRLFRRYLDAFPLPPGSLRAYAMSIVNADGFAYANSVEVPTPPVYAGDRDYFQHHMQNPGGNVYLSRVARSRVTGLWVIFLSIGMRDSAGRFEGVMTMSLRVGELEEFYRRLDLPEGSTIVLLRSDGRTLYRHPFEHAYADLDISGSPEFREIRRLGSGHLRVSSSPIDSRSRIFGFHAGNEFPLISVVSNLRSEAIAPWQRGVMAYAAVGLAALATVTLLALFVLRQLRLLEQATSASLHDPLTGLPNRRHCREHLSAEWRRMARDRRPLAVLFLDIDHFKRYNDHYGHAQGDACLRQIAALLGAQIRREGDMIARYGGEEFVCVLPGTDAAGATAMAEAFSRTVTSAKIPHADSPIGPHITLSIGCATTVPDLARDPDALLDLADQSLYGAKRGGRNRIVASTDTPAT